MKWSGRAVAPRLALWSRAAHALAVAVVAPPALAAGGTSAADARGGDRAGARRGAAAGRGRRARGGGRLPIAAVARRRGCRVVAGPAATCAPTTSRSSAFDCSRTAAAGHLSRTFPTTIAPAPTLPSRLHGGRVEAARTSARAEREAVDAERLAAAAGRSAARDHARLSGRCVTAREAVGVLDALARAHRRVRRRRRARVDAGLLPPNDAAVGAGAAARAERAARSRRRNARGARRGGSRAARRRDQAGTDHARPPVASARIGAPGSRPDGRRALIARARAAARAAGAGRRAGGAARAADAAAQAARGRRSPCRRRLEPARPNPRFVPARRRNGEDSWDLGVNADLAAVRRRQGPRRARRGGGQRDALRPPRSRISIGRSRRDPAAPARSRVGPRRARRRQRGVRAAAEARRVVDERFRAGVATSTEVLDAQTDVLEAELERTRALPAALRLTEARLVRAVGR